MFSALQGLSLSWRSDARKMESMVGMSGKEALTLMLEAWTSSADCGSPYGCRQRSDMFLFVS